jgi:hypothetical protein
MKPRVYIETSILSYLTGRPSRDLVVAAHQQLTAEWWQQRDSFELFASEFVLNEAREGDGDAATRRLAAAVELSMLTATDAAQALTARLLVAAAMPAKAAIDAAHVAVATIHGMQFLLTWNCAHIANAAMRPKIEGVCRDAGFQPPIICTPEELLIRDEP